MAGTSNSYADRIAQQYEQETGRAADANDPAYAEYVQRMLPQLVAQDRADYQASKDRWGVVDRIATAGTLGLLGAGVGSALAGAGGAAGASGASAGGGVSLPAAATEGIGFSAAPVVSGGGASLLGRALDIGGGIADTMANAGQQSFENRTVENSARNSRNMAEASLYNTNQAATTNATNAEETGKLNRAEIGLRAPTIRARQSLLGSAMANMQPVTVSGLSPRVASRVPTISGGLTPAMLSDTTRAHGKALQEAAMNAQFTGSDIPTPTDFKAGVLPKPALSPYREAGALENTLGGAGLLGSVLNNIDDLMQEWRH